MADMTSRLIVDRYSRVLSELVQFTFAVLILVWCATYFFGVFSNPSGGITDLITPWVDALFTWFVWKDPAVIMAVVVPLAIALQVAVHGLRAEMASTIYAARPPRVHEQEMKRIQLFSRIAIASASLIAIFTVLTVLASILGRSGNQDVSTSTTVALCGVVTATLCLDAARVATTQDLKQRLVTAETAQQKWKLRLRPLKRDVPPRRFVWLSSGVLAAAVIIFPAAAFEYHDAAGAAAQLHWGGIAAKLGLCLVFSIFMMMFLALNFGAFLILAAVADVPKFFRVIILPVFAIPTCIVLVASFVDTRTEPLIRYCGGVLPTIALISMLVAWWQVTRDSSSWITRMNLGFNTLLRFWALNLVLRRFRTSNDHVSWLKHALHEPQGEPDSGVQANNVNASSPYDRVSNFLTGLTRR